MGGWRQKLAIAGPPSRAYDFRSGPRGGQPMKSVARILKAKADQTIYTIAPTASVFEAVKLMAEKNIGALVVMEGEKIVGIITERDYARKIVLMARSSKDTPVRDIMTCVGHVRKPRPQERGMHGADDRKPGAPPARHRQRQVDWPCLHRRPRQRHHLGAEIHHPTTRTLHHRGAGFERLRPQHGFRLFCRIAIALLASSSESTAT